MVSSYGIGRVEGNLYIGRFSAGGDGRSIDINGDGKSDLDFDRSCRFVAQRDERGISAVESDREVTMTIGGWSMKLQPFTPVRLPR
jgi:hypothetical protein